MNLLDDIKNVSDAAIGKIAAQFTDLPRPLLAAIGAGDIAVERLAQLRDQLSDKFNDTVGDRFSEGLGAASNLTENLPSGDDVKAFAADLPAKAQKIAADVAAQIEKLAGEVPGRAQQLIADLPAKAQEVANSLGRENLRSTVDGYTQFVAMVYGQLADRGGDTVAKVAADHATTDTKHVDSEVTPVKRSSTTPAGGKTASGSAKKPAAEKAAKKPAADKPAAAKKPAAKKSTGKPVAKSAADKPAAKAAATKTTGDASDAKSATATEPATDGTHTP